MVRYIIIVSFVLLFCIGLVSAEASYTFRQHEEVNYRFRCITNSTNTYCSSSTQLIINVEYPNGSNALDNISMTYNPTYFNITLPTMAIGDYEGIILSPTVNGTISEFTYEVTPSGFTNNVGFYFLVLLFSFGFIVFGFWISDPWVTILGTFGLYFFGIYILLYGIVGINDAITVRSIAIIILAVAGYISIRSGLEVLER